MQCFKMIFTALRILIREKLIFLTTESSVRIEDYKFLKRLREEYDYVQKPNTTINDSSTVQINNQTKEIKFKLRSIKMECILTVPHTQERLLLKKKLLSNLERNMFSDFGTG